MHYWKDCINASPDTSDPLLFGFAFDEKRRQFSWADLVLKTPHSAFVEIPLLVTTPTVPRDAQLQNLQKALDAIAAHCS